MDSFLSNELIASLNHQEIKQAKQIKESILLGQNAQIKSQKKKTSIYQSNRKIIDFKSYKLNNKNLKNKSMMSSKVLIDQSNNQTMEGEKIPKLHLLYHNFLTKCRQMSEQKVIQQKKQNNISIEIKENPKKQQKPEKHLFPKHKTIVLRKKTKDWIQQISDQIDLLEKIQQKMAFRSLIKYKSGLNNKKRVKTQDLVQKIPLNQKKGKNTLTKQPITKALLMKISKSKTIAHTNDKNNESLSYDVLNFKSPKIKHHFSFNLRKFQGESNLLSYSINMQKQKKKPDKIATEINNIQGWQYQHQHSFQIL